MSELPRSNPRLENFEAKRAEQEQKAFEAALYADAGETDLSTTDSVDYGNLSTAVKEARRHGRKITREDYAQMPENQRNGLRRVEEADAYERHMEALANDNRSSLDRTLDRVESGELSERVDPLVEEAYMTNDHHDGLAMHREYTIQNTKELRHANQLAERIAALYNKPVGEVAETDKADIHHLEARVSALLEKYSETDGADPAIIDEIINRAHRTPEVKTDTGKTAASKEEKEEINFGTDEELAALANKSDGINFGTDEELAALAAGETLTEEETPESVIAKWLNDHPELASHPEVQKRIGEILAVIDGAGDDDKGEQAEDKDKEEARKRELIEEEKRNVTDGEREAAHGIALVEEEKRNVTDAERNAAHEEALKELGERTMAQREEELQEFHADRRNSRWSWKDPGRRLHVFFMTKGRDFMEAKRGTKVTSAILLGAVAAAGVYLAYRLGHQPSGNGGHGVQEALPNDSGASTGPVDRSPLEHGTPVASEFSDAARTAHNGEGWLNQLRDMNVPESERSGLLKKILESDDPDIKKWVYEMGDGNPGISRPGAIPESVLESIEELRNK